MSLSVHLQVAFPFVHSLLHVKRVDLEVGDYLATLKQDARRVEAVILFDTLAALAGRAVSNRLTVKSFLNTVLRSQCCHRFII